jgi:MOSC domain-containing protein YiiM
MIIEGKTGKLAGIAIKQSTRAPMILKESAIVTVEKGVEGDHRGNQEDRQVTVISREAWEKACQDLKRNLPWIYRRANLLVEGISILKSTGQFLKIEDLVLQITGETKPCYRMDELYPGLQDVLKLEWRGGVTCRVIKSGNIKINDLVIMNEMFD